MPHHATAPPTRLALETYRRPGRGLDPRAGGGRAAKAISPCAKNPDAWHISLQHGRQATAAQIRAAVAGCADCKLERPEQWARCRDTPRDSRVPRTVMAGAVIGLARQQIHPETYISRLRRPAADTATRGGCP